MTEQTTQEVKKDLFIPAEHRPESRPNLAKYPPIRPDASYEEIRRCAYEVLEDWRRADLIAANARSPAELWSSIMRRNDDVIWEVLDDEAVLLNLDSATYYTLNPVGTAFWELCDGQRSMEDVLTEVLSVFDASEDVLRGDLAAIAAQLLLEKLLIERGSYRDKDEETIL